MVLKKNGDWRLCVDYRKLNNLTIKDSYSLPLIDDILTFIGNTKILSTIDLFSGYHQIPMATEDKDKTAFTTMFGNFNFKVMPFGLCNAPATFQREMNRIFFDLIGVCLFVYIDDLIIFSHSMESHLEHLSKVFTILQENNLKINLEKCDFFKTEVTILGHRLSVNGLSPIPEKVKIIANWTPPKTITQLKSFLGAVGYYRKFIKNFSIVASILFKLIRKDSKFVWGPKQQEAFNKLKELLTSAPVLSLPDPNKQFVLETDASHFALGYVLSQYDDEHHLHPVYYYSRSFTKPERNYSISDKELLSIIAGLEEWRLLLIGTKESILILTDHRNLLFATKPQRLSLR